MTRGDAEWVEQVWRRESPYVLAALLRRHGDLADCEDAVQEAAAAAVAQWGRRPPDDPRGWLVRVASRRLVDRMRSDRSRTAREDRLAGAESATDGDAGSDADDSLAVLLLCCHPALSRPAQTALVLRCVAGLSTERIAAAHLVPTATMAQRLSRARTALRDAGARFEQPALAELPDRVTVVLDVCHLMATEGHLRTGGSELLDADLAAEALRLVRLLHAALPDHDEVSGLLALLLLTAARSGSRVDDDGDLVPLAEQDRTRWDRDAIAEGVALLERVLPRGPVGRYQLQAAVAAVHAEAPDAASTDWAQISALYAMLHEVAPGPAVTLNRAVAVGMADGPQAGLALLAPLLELPAMHRHHRVHAVRAHLLERIGDHAAAAAAYRTAARLTTSRPEQRYLNRRLTALTPPVWSTGAARGWSCAPAPDGVREFHRTLPGYRPTPLVEVPELAGEWGVRRVLVKDESARLGLPAFKALGVTHAVRRVVEERSGTTVPSFAALRTAVAGSTLELVTATDGNHGRALARFARLLGVAALVHLPDVVEESQIDAIRDEGAQVVVLTADYDETVRAAAAAAARRPDAVLVQDTAWPGYEQTPQHVVDGYSTMFAEIDDQLADDRADVLVTPMGVGSLAQAVVTHAKSRPRPVAVLGVEPDTAACVRASLRAGSPSASPTGSTVMAGLNCGTVSSLAWPFLRDGLDAATVVTDAEALAAVAELGALGVPAGPCGAATVPGLRAALADPAARGALGLGPDAVVVLLSTEGPRPAVSGT